MIIDKKLKICTIFINSGKDEYFFVNKNFNNSVLFPLLSQKDNYCIVNLSLPALLLYSVHVCTVQPVPLLSL